MKRRLVDTKCPRKALRSFAIVVASGLTAMSLSACEGDEVATGHDSATYGSEVKRIEIESVGGNIEFIASDRDDIGVELEYQWSGEKPASAEVVDGDTLRIEVVGCTGVGASSCSISYTFELPAGIEIEAETKAGNIDLTGMNADFVVETKAGNVTGTGIAAGTVEATSGAGNVDLRVVTKTDDVKAHSNAGNVDVTFAVPPTIAEATTDAGNATIIVPDDGTVYIVESKSNAGADENDIATDAEAERELKATTKAGNARVAYR